MNNVFIVGNVVGVGEVVSVGAKGTRMLEVQIESEEYDYSSKSVKKTLTQVVSFGSSADNMYKYVKVGDFVAVEGKVNTSKFLSKTGKTCYNTTIVVTGWKKPTNFRVQSNEEFANNQKKNFQEMTEYEPTLDIPSSDLPF